MQPEAAVKTLRETKALFKKEIRGILSHSASEELDEAAFPAYAHRNPLIEYLFWGRLRVAYNWCRNRPGQRVLDFGCGPGILTYALARSGRKVIGLDTNLAPVKALQERITFPDGVKFIEGDILRVPIEPGSVDLLFALDVLEHIDDLEPYLDRFEELLSPDGSIVVSVPTESWLYRIGRRLAGERFTGHYHQSSAGPVRSAFEKRFEVEPLATLLPFAPLFQIFVARVRR